MLCFLDKSLVIKKVKRCGMPEKVVASNENIRMLVQDAIKNMGPHCDLNFIDVSKVSDMSGIFADSKFNGDISKWDVSNAIDMSELFARSAFNGDISNWNVSNVRDMSRMFECAEFNGDISQWNVSNVAIMDDMFAGSQFNGDLSQWKKSCIYFEYLLIECYYSKYERDHDYIYFKTKMAELHMPCYKKVKELIVSSFDDFKEILFEWADKGDQNARDFLINFYTAEYFGKFENRFFLERVFEWADKGNQNAIDFLFNYYTENSKELRDSLFLERVYEWIVYDDDDNAKEFIYKLYNSYEFPNIIMPLFAMGEDRACEIVYENYESLKDNIKEWVSFDANKPIQDIVLDNFEDFDNYYETIVQWANNGNKVAENAVYSHCFDDSLNQNLSSSQRKYADYFRSVIIDWAVQNDEVAKKFVYDNYSDFDYKCLSRFINSEIKRADNNDPAFKELVCDNPGEFVEIIMQWIANGDDCAKECAYENPNLFQKLILKWADNGDENAKKAIYDRFFCVLDFGETYSTVKNAIVKWAFAECQNMRAKEIVNTHMSSFKKEITDLAENGCEKANELIYKNTHVFCEIISKRALKNDKTAKEIVYKDYAFFEGTIVKLANQGDDRSLIIAFDKLKYNYSQRIISLAIKGDNAARQAIYHWCNKYPPRTFVDTILLWAEQNESEAIELVYFNYSKDPLYALKILEWAVKNDSAQKERAVSFIKNNTDILLLIEEKLLEYEKNNNTARELVFSIICNENCKKRIELRASENNQQAIEIVYTNYEDESFAETITHFAEAENDGAGRAKEFIYQHPTHSVFAQSIIRWSNNGDLRAKQIILDHPEKDIFKVYIDYWKRLSR